MKEITIKLTENEANELFNLVSDSKEAGNGEWYALMQSIETKLLIQLDKL